MQEIFTELIQTADKLPVAGLRICPVDSGWRTSLVTGGIEEFGYTRENFLHGDATWLDMIHPEDRDAAYGITQGRMLRGEDCLRLDCRTLSPSGAEFPVTLYLRAVCEPGGQMGCVDIMLLKRNGASFPQSGISSDIRRQMVLNDIVFSLNENPTRDPAQLIIAKAGAYLDISRVTLMALTESKAPCQAVNEWLNAGIPPGPNNGSGRLCGDESREIRLRLNGNEPYVLNAGELPDKLARAMREQGILSAALAPVQIGVNCRACLRFEDLKKARDWDEASLRFIKNIASLVSRVLLEKNGSPGGTLSQRACETVLDNIGAFIFASRPETGEIVFANRAFRLAFGEECLGSACGDFMLLGPEQEIETFAETGGLSLPAAFETCLEKTGQWLSVSRDLVPWMDGSSVHLHNCHDITFKKNYEDSIKRLAYLDHLTGLPNRYRCDVDIRAAINAMRAGEKAGYLLFIDLDDFKVVNDSYGHHYGDGVLMNFAAFLQENYGQKHRVYRFGGDEFVVLLSDCDQDCLSSILNNILDRSKDPWKSINREFYCSLSIGVVEINPFTHDPKLVLQHADVAMYEAKHSGKSSYVFYSEGLEDAAIERSEMEWLLREALENDFQGFEIHYQPYANTKDLKIVGAEALVRMRGRDGELLLPGAFLPLAEYLGLIIPLGEHILRSAASQCKAVNDSGLPDFSVTINLSARQFRQQNFLDRLEDILRSTGVDFSNIIISINENVALKELRRILQLCGSLRRHGIRVALDDFGSGAASFINMRDLPVDIIKVSSSYIDDYRDEHSDYFIRLVKDLSHFSGKTVCMNGVEEKEHYEYCQKLGLDMVQGFLFHRPESVKSLETLLTTR